jgi:hypothetical protein
MDANYLGDAESCDATPFGWFRFPKWQRMKKEEVEQLVGSDWPEVFPARLQR